jgi:hypothetical protein
LIPVLSTSRFSGPSARQ